jgi:hypothetical protein
MTRPLVRLQDIDAEALVSRVVGDAYEAVRRLAPELWPLVEIQVGEPRHDVPGGVSEARSWVFDSTLGLNLRDLVLYAQRGEGPVADEATALLVKMNRALGRDLPHAPLGVCRDELDLVARAVVGRALLAQGGDLAPAYLASLGGIEPEGVEQLAKLGEITMTSGGVVLHEEAVRWLVARGVPGAGNGR